MHKLFLIIVAALLLSACGGSGENDATGDGAAVTSGGGLAPGGAAVGHGISVEEALASRLDGPLLINGWLWRADGDDPRICTSLTASLPPKCNEPSLTVEGPFAVDRYTLRRQGNTAWSDQAVQLLGTVRGKTLKLAPLSR